MDKIVSLLTDNFSSISFSLLGIYIVTYVALKAHRSTLQWKELIVDSNTGAIDFKMLMMIVCALLQSFTWIRLSLGFKVDTALDTPALWITFYSVIAGHDLLGKAIAVWGKNSTPPTPPTDS